jgi:putative spermidine/putrescine transport system substrate-binding protein
MKRMIATTTAIFAMCCAAQAATARDLTVVGFGGSLQDAMRGNFFQPYSKEKKLPILEESYTGGIAKIKAMVETNTTSWDVVQMDENEMILACDEALLEKFDWKSLPYASEISNVAKSPCGVGAFVWSMVTAFDGDKIQGVNSWADFWDVKRWPGKRGLRKEARMTMEIALLADGVAPEHIYEVLGTKAGQDRAFAKLDQLKPYIQWWESGAQPVDWLASGDVAMAAAYNGRVISANKQGRHFQMSWKNQLYAMDFWAIPKGGNTKQAFDLVQYMTSAEPQKHFAEQMVYGVTNVSATQLIEPAIQPQLPSAPENLVGAVALSTPFWVDHEEELQRRFNNWVAQ